MPLAVTKLDTFPHGGDWNAAAHNGSVHVAMLQPSTGAPCFYSSSDNGATWVMRARPTTLIAGGGAWRMRWVHNAFFASALNFNNNAVYRSADGITWAAVTMPSSTFWRGVAYGAGKFVALASGTATATSLDGITWTAGTAVTSRSWIDIEFGAGLFVGICQVNGIFMTSPDGVTWTQRSAGSTLTQAARLFFINSTFVALSESGIGYNTTSPDGLVWTSGTASGIGMSGLVYINSMYVVTNVAESDVYKTTTDFVTWTTRALPRVGSWISTHGATGTHVMLLRFSSVTYKTTNGISWASGGSLYGLATDVGDIAVGAGGMALFFPYAFLSYDYYTSTDGVNWVTRIHPGFNQAYLGGARYGGQMSWTGVRFIAGTGNYHAVTTSPDGITWNEVDTNVYTRFIGFANGIAFQFGARYNPSGQDFITRSTDHGQSWSAPTAVPAITGGAASLNAVAFGAGLYVIIGQGGTGYLTSPDGATWTPRDFPASDNDTRRTIIWTGSFFMTVTMTTAFKSFDGLNWTAAALPLPVSQDAPYELVLREGLIWVFQHNKIVYSADGEAWTVDTLGSPFGNYYPHPMNYQQRFLVFSDTNYTAQLDPFWTGFINCQELS